MSTISAFKAQMLGGGARSNQYKVELTFPALAGGAGVAAGNAAQFLCKAASLPESTIEDIPVLYRGREVHMAGERQYQPWQVQILNDNNFLIRNALEKWQAAISNYQTTNGVLRPQDYQVRMHVHQLDRNDVTVKSYEFFDVYPSVVSEVQLSFDQSTIEEFGVTFIYNYFQPSDI